MVRKNYELSLSLGYDFAALYKRERKKRKCNDGGENNPRGKFAGTLFFFFYAAACNVDGASADLFAPRVRFRRNGRKGT